MSDETIRFDPEGDTSAPHIEISRLKEQLNALQQENRALRRSLSEAAEANTAKEVFLSNMSHDIRTPMNAIIGMTALAQKYIDEKPRVIDALNKIEVAGGHLLSLINEVLDMSRINSGRMVLADELFSLGDLLHDTLTIVRPQAEQKKHELRFTTGEIVYESLYGDVTRLRQIFVNIINNSVKYTPDGGRIDIRISEKTEQGTCVLVFVCTDNGIGMTPEFLQKIYEPFERVNSTTVSRIEGSGLGMSIVQKLIEAMNGEIGIESEPGKGTTFTLRIPLRYEEFHVDTAPLQEKSLLIIETDEELRDTYRRYLADSGIRYSFVSSSSEAVEFLADGDYRDEHPDLVILGKAVGQTGSLFELAGYIRKSHPSIPILLVSDHDWNQIEYRANRSGIDRFIPVPFFRKSLLLGLTEALQEENSSEGGLAVADLSDRHILLAEDNFINREIAGEVLRATHAEVDMAEDGQQAVDTFMASEEGYYDLILMDIQMPVMDGYTAVKHIRESSRSDHNVRIYAMTANTFAEDIAKARSAGMDGHIAKPIDVNKLMLMLRQIL